MLAALDDTFPWLGSRKITLLRLNKMFYYALYLSYHSNREAVLFVCLSSGWATTTGRLLGPKVGNSTKCHSQGHIDALTHWESNQSFATFKFQVYFSSQHTDNK